MPAYGAIMSALVAHFSNPAQVSPPSEVDNACARTGPMASNWHLGLVDSGCGEGNVRLIAYHDAGQRG